MRLGLERGLPMAHAQAHMDDLMSSNVMMFQHGPPGPHGVPGAGIHYANAPAKGFSYSGANLSALTTSGN